MINVGREAMLAVGCIQAQRCHTGRCPTGVATQSRWLMRGLDPELKSARAANYMRRAARRAAVPLALVRRRAPRACHARPRRDRRRALHDVRRVEDVFGYEPGWADVPPERREEIEALIGPPAERRRPGPESRPYPWRRGGEEVELLGQSDDDALGATQEAEPVEVLVLRDLADELATVAAQAGDDVVDVVDERT